jgi:hypothetical protein
LLNFSIKLAQFTNRLHEGRPRRFSRFLNRPDDLRKA